MGPTRSTNLQPGGMEKVLGTGFMRSSESACFRCDAGGFAASAFMRLPVAGIEINLGMFPLIETVLNRVPPIILNPKPRGSNPPPWGCEGRSKEKGLNPESPSFLVLLRGRGQRSRT